jgi:hypothetical protein
MIDDVLRTKYLIVRVHELEEADFDRLNQLHELALTTEERNDKLSQEIADMYNKYRHKGVCEDESRES